MDDLTSSQDSELERNRELMKEEYTKYLNDAHDTNTNSVVLSKSF